MRDYAYLRSFVYFDNDACPIRSIYSTRIKTFTKAKFKKSDDNRNIVQYREAANVTEYHII